MVEQNVCRICKQPLPPQKTGRPRKTCSNACRQRARHMRVRALHESVRRSERAYREGQRRVKAAVRKYGPLDVVTRMRLSRGALVFWCRHCGRPYTPRAESGRVPYGCSRTCVDALRKGRKGIEAAIRKALEHGQEPMAWALEGWLDRGVLVTLCRRCQRPFFSTGRRGPKPMYCSKRCSMAHWRARQRICPVCGTRFDRMNTKRVLAKKYCSRKCKDKAHGWRDQDKKGAEIKDSWWRKALGRGARKTRQIMERQRALDHQMAEAEWRAMEGINGNFPVLSAQFPETADRIADRGALPDSEVRG